MVRTSVSARGLAQIMRTEWSLQRCMSNPDNAASGARPLFHAGRVQAIAFPS